MFFLFFSEGFWNVSMPAWWGASKQNNLFKGQCCKLCLYCNNLLFLLLGRLRSNETKSLLASRLFSYLLVRAKESRSKDQWPPEKALNRTNVSPKYPPPWVIEHRYLLVSIVLLLVSISWRWPLIFHHRGTRSRQGAGELFRTAERRLEIKSGTPRQSRPKKGLISISWRLTVSSLRPIPTQHYWIYNMLFVHTSSSSSEKGSWKSLALHN